MAEHNPYDKVAEQFIADYKSLAPLRAEIQDTFNKPIGSLAEPPKGSQSDIIKRAELGEISFAEADSLLAKLEGLPRKEGGRFPIESIPQAEHASFLEALLSPLEADIAAGRWIESQIPYFTEAREATGRFIQKAAQYAPNPLLGPLGLVSEFIPGLKSVPNPFAATGKFIGRVIEEDPLLTPFNIATLGGASLATGTAKAVIKPLLRSTIAKATPRELAAMMGTTRAIHGHGAVKPLYGKFPPGREIAGGRGLAEGKSEIDQIANTIDQLTVEIEGMQASHVIRPKWGVGMSDDELRAIANHEGLNPYLPDWYDQIDSVIIREAHQGYFRVQGATTLTMLKNEKAALTKHLELLKEQKRLVAEGLDPATAFKPTPEDLKAWAAPPTGEGLVDAAALDAIRENIKLLDRKGLAALLKSSKSLGRKGKEIGQEAADYNKAIVKEIQAAQSRRAMRDFLPPIPKAVEGTPEAGFQPGMLGVPGKAVTPTGRGVPTQASLDAALRLEEIRLTRLDAEFQSASGNKARAIAAKKRADAQDEIIRLENQIRQDEIIRQQPRGTRSLTEEERALIRQDVATLEAAVAARTYDPMPTELAELAGIKAAAPVPVPPAVTPAPVVEGISDVVGPELRRLILTGSDDTLALQLEQSAKQATKRNPVESERAFHQEVVKAIKEEQARRKLGGVEAPPTAPVLPAAPVAKGQVRPKLSEEALASKHIEDTGQIPWEGISNTERDEAAWQAFKADKTTLKDTVDGSGILVHPTTGLQVPSGLLADGRIAINRRLLEEKSIAEIIASDPNAPRGLQAGLFKDKTEFAEFLLQHEKEHVNMAADGFTFPSALEEGLASSRALESLRLSRPPKPVFPEPRPAAIGEGLPVSEGVPPISGGVPPVTGGVPPARPPIEPTGSSIVPSYVPGARIMGDLDPFAGVVDATVRPDIWRKIANLPGVRSFLRPFNPSAVANKPVEQSLVGRAVLREEAQQLTLGAMSRVIGLGPLDQIFGKVTKEGLLEAGPYKGVAINTIRTFPKRYPLISKEAKEWISVANDVEKAKLAALKAEGIEIRELAFEEGGQYAGRRVFGKVGQDGELLDTGAVMAGPARVGAKTTQEKMRIFETVEEAIEKGYRYLADDETLFLNVAGAYNRIADKRMAEWLLSRVPWRTSGADEHLKLAAASAIHKRQVAEGAIESIQRALRGEQLHHSTVRSIEATFPEAAENLGQATRITLQDLVAAGAEAAKPAVVLPVPNPGTIKKLQKLVNEAFEAVALDPDDLIASATLARLRRQLGFVKYRFSLGEPFVLEKNAVKLLRDRQKAGLNELLTTFRGVAKRERLADGKVKVTYSRGIIHEARAEANAAIVARTQSAEKAATLRVGEARIDAPAFAGKMFTGPEAVETARIMRAGLSPSFNKALGAVNQVNAVARYFMLGADVSTQTIQLLFLAGYSPRIYGKATKGLVQAIFEPEFHARYLARPENQRIIQRYPLLVLTKGGRTEFTEAVAKGGLLRKGPLKIVGFLLRPFQRGFEGALDVAGIEMAKALDHSGTTLARRMDIAQFINEFRGVTSSSRLGVSTFMRQVETTAVLAPRYNRAIAGLLFDVFHGGLRGSLARKALGSGVASLMAMAIVISYARGESFDEIVDHLDPRSGKFFTWEVGGQNIGPGTKVRSVMRVFGLTAKDPSTLTDESLGFGKGQYVKNPLIKFIRGNAAPLASTGWDLFTGKDYLGDPTRDGLLSFTDTISKRFMPIWIQSVALDGGDLGERATRGVAEFFGLRAYPASVLGNLSQEWKSDIDAYNDIATSKEERLEKGQRFSRDSYRKIHPETDAELFILGRITTLKTYQARLHVIRIMQENGLEPEDIKGYENVFGDLDISQPFRQQNEVTTTPALPAILGGDAPEVPALPALPAILGGDAPDTAGAPLDNPVPGQRRGPGLQSINVAPDGPAAPAAPAEKWESVIPFLDSTLLSALDQVWYKGETLSEEDTQRLQALHQQQSFGEDNFNTWLKLVLRQAYETWALQQMAQAQPAISTPVANEPELQNVGR